MTSSCASVSPITAIRSSVICTCHDSRADVEMCADLHRHYGKLKAVPLSSLAEPYPPVTTKLAS